jgi:hypothetical protein
MIRVNVTMEHLQVPSISCSVLTHASITWQHQCLVLVEVWVLIAGRERQQLLHSLPSPVDRIGQLYVAEVGPSQLFSR